MRRHRAAQVRRWWRGVDVPLVIAAGGAVGGLARWGLNAVLPTVADGFPWSTVVENVLGSLLLGALLVWLTEVVAPGRYVRPFLGVGVLGSFTTFATYTSETTVLLLDGRVAVALGYLVGTAVTCMAAAWTGMTLVRWAVAPRRHRGDRVAGRRRRRP